MTNKKVLCCCTEESVYTQETSGSASRRFHHVKKVTSISAHHCGPRDAAYRYFRPCTSSSSRKKARHEGSSDGREETLGSLREEGPSGFDRSEFRNQRTASDVAGHR